MQVDLAKPQLQPRVGPPACAGPTVAQFFRNVEVKRGKTGVTPDELYCDHLRLTLVPGDKEKAKVESGEESEDEARHPRGPGRTSLCKAPELRATTSASSPPRRGSRPAATS